MKREASLYRISGEERSFGFNIPLKRLKKVMVVMAAARISLTGSARKTANTLLDKKSGRIKMRGSVGSVFAGMQEAEQPRG